MKVNFCCRHLSEIRYYFDNIRERLGSLLVIFASFSIACARVENSIEPVIFDRFSFGTCFDSWYPLTMPLPFTICMAVDLNHNPKYEFQKTKNGNQGECTSTYTTWIWVSLFDASHGLYSPFVFVAPLEKKYLIYHFAECFEFFRPLFLSVFGWLFTKITYSTLVLSYHILDITYHDVLFQWMCCVRLPLSHMWCIYIRQHFARHCWCFLYFFCTLACSLACLPAWYTLLFAVHNIKDSRQIATMRLHIQSTYALALGERSRAKASKKRKQNKYENEDEWDQIGKHKDSRTRYEIKSNGSREYNLSAVQQDAQSAWRTHISIECGKRITFRAAKQQ